MKTILITEANRKQIVMTQETDFERSIIKMFGDGSKEAKIYLGGYYHCQGGWTRQGEKDSLLVVFDDKITDVTIDLEQPSKCSGVNEMSKATMDAVFAPVEARYREQVMQSTWGHLAPKKNKKYKGHIVFATGSHGSDNLNPTILSAEFYGLDDSPWLFEAMQDFMFDNRGEPGNVYRFDGAIKNYEFQGGIATVYSVNSSRDS